jgi:surfeit locus 1 family protein
MTLTKPTFRLHVFGYNFTPKLIPTLAFCCVMPILLSLGFWQLHRAEEKKQLLEANKTQAPTRLVGKYDNEHQLLLDNRYHQHQLGYEVLTPLIINANQTFLVNRGWVARGNSRNSIPALSPINGTQTVTGRLKPIPRTVFHLGAENSQGWPRIIESLSQQSLANIDEHRNLQPTLLLLNADQPHGFIREFVVTEMTPAKHLGYAVQWFAMAFTLMIIYLTLSLRRRP